MQIATLKTSLLITFSLLIICECRSQNDFPSLYFKAKEAYKNKSNLEFTSLIQKALQLNPGHQGALYYSGIASCINGRPDEALMYLKKCISIDSRYDLLKNEDLSILKNRKDFQDLVLYQAETVTPIITSDTAFVVGDRQLHVEGIAYESETKMFYLGSIHKRKIIKVDRDGHATDFSSTTNPTMASIFGLKIDSKRKFLWVCSSSIPETNQYDPSIRSRVFKFNIANAILLDAYEPDSTVKGPIFGDITLSAEGDVFVSDSKNNIIFKLNESTKKLEKFFESTQFTNLQGLTFSDDNTILYIADYVKGLFALSMQSKQLLKIIEPSSISLKGIDGLLYYKKSLIAIQNGVFPLRVVRYELGPAGTTIVDAHTIDSNHPAFNEPTLGTINDNELYYIANSQWSGYDENHQIKSADKLYDIVILRTNLSSFQK